MTFHVNKISIVAVTEGRGAQDMVNLLKLSFQWKGWYFQESQVNLADPDDLPMLYPRVMTIAAIYPQDVKRVLIVGLGGGAIPTYLGRFLPDAMIDSVALDPGVIDLPTISEFAKRASRASSTATAECS
jgi:hypothetical protein